MYWVSYRFGDGEIHTLKHGLIKTFFTHRWDADMAALDLLRRCPEAEVWVTPIELSAPVEVELKDHTGDIENEIFEAVQKIEGINTVELARVDGKDHIKANFVDAAYDYVIRIEKVAK